MGAERCVTVEEAGLEVKSAAHVREWKHLFSGACCVVGSENTGSAP